MLAIRTLPRSTAIGLVALRLYAGLFWMEKGIRQKLLDPHWVGPKGDCAFVINDMLTNAPGFYQAFLHTVVLPNITAFSVMVEWGETLVGVSLLLGLFSRIGAIGGLLLVSNYFMGNGAGSLRDGWFGFDTTTFMMTALHVILPTGLFFGLDALIRQRTGTDARRSAPT
jgi:uncharacterized membrane protein YphA (DoxX/SURF4 family)